MHQALSEWQGWSEWVMVDGAFVQAARLASSDHGAGTRSVPCSAWRRGDFRSEMPIKTQSSSGSPVTVRVGGTMCRFQEQPGDPHPFDRCATADSGRWVGLTS